MVQWRISKILPAILLVIAGCNTVADISEGQPREGVACLNVADCTVDVPECQTAVACANTVCVFENAPDGMPLSVQAPGDCLRMVCDGLGKSKQVVASLDAPDDGNPCTLDACDDFVPVHTLLTELPCYSGTEWTEGKGVCKAGVQHCDAQGNPIGGCEGEVIPQAETCASTVDDDCDGQANEEGTDCLCHPGDIIPCYTGPAATQNVGACLGGQQGCSADGLGYGSCVGEQTPLAESCDAAMVDEDCDGQVNEEGADCACGDFIVQASQGEECDDGNQDSTDGCTALCKLPVCGDGFVQPGAGEECEDGNADPTDGCAMSCKLPACGDGFLQYGAGEDCDDGNLQDGDGCPATCRNPIVALAIRREHACAVFLEGQVKCWGRNDFGNLGLGDTTRRGDGPNEMGASLPVVDLGTGERAVGIAVGDYHTCALLAGGRVKCWGRNAQGELGLGDTQNRGVGPNEMGDNLPAVDLGIGKTATAVSAGSGHTCILLSNGGVKCWGRNTYGQLGLGDTQARGDGPGEMGELLPAVDLGTGKMATAVAAGYRHTCALLNDGGVKCWGQNTYGQLGAGDTQDRGDGSGEMGDMLAPVDLGSGRTAVAIAAGWTHTCALLDDGNLKCWGQNAEGKLGLGDIQDRGDVPGEMGDSLPAIDLGMGKQATSFSAGSIHTCAQLTGGAVKCWGSGYYATLGLGTGLSYGDKPDEMGDNLPAVDLGTGKKAMDVVTGESSNCVLLEEGKIKCWGSNGSGQLGLGDTQPRGLAPVEMGDNLPEVMLW